VKRDMKREEERSSGKEQGAVGDTTERLSQETIHCCSQPCACPQAPRWRMLRSKNPFFPLYRAVVTGSANDDPMS